MVRQRHRLKRFAAHRGLIVLAIFAQGCAVNQPATYERDAEERTGSSAPLEQGMSSASRSLLSTSRTHSSAGNYAQAAAALERAIRIEPNQPALWLELGHVRFLEGDYPQAEQCGRKARSLAGGDRVVESRAAQLIADALRGQGRYNEAQLILAPET